MKTKTDKSSVTPEAVKEAGLKATQARRLADADDRVARAAKIQLKSAKKTWKLARKAAKRSAKRARHAEKEFRALEKQARRYRPKPKAAIKKKSSMPRPAARSKTVRQPPARISASAPASGTVPPPAAASSAT